MPVIGYLTGQGFQSNNGHTLKSIGYRPLRHRETKQMLGSGLVILGGQELVVNQQAVTGQLQVNSTLTEREWARLDDVVYAMQSLQMNAVQDLIGRGLSVPGYSLADYTINWRVASEKRQATASMSTRTRRDRDRVDRHQYGVPLPVVIEEYEIEDRELLASRQSGAPLDVDEARESTKAVTEYYEATLFDGDSDIVVGSNSIPGYRTITGRDTGTAAAYGGGDFGTIDNIYPTFKGMVAALVAKRFRGPFIGYVPNIQYFEMLEIFSDGSGETALQRVLRGIPQIEDIKRSDFATTDEILLVQMTPDVVELAIALEIMNREFTMPNDDTFYGKVMAAMVQKIKTNHSGNVGIAHATGA